MATTSTINVHGLSRRDVRLGKPSYDDANPVRWLDIGGVSFFVGSSNADQETLADQAAAMRRIATHATQIADELTARVVTYSPLVESEAVPA